MRLRQSGRPWRVLQGASVTRFTDHLRPGTSYRLQVLLRQQHRSDEVLLTRPFRTQPNPLMHVSVRSARAGSVLRWQAGRAVAATVHRYTVRILHGTTVVRTLHSSQKPAARMSLALPRLRSGRYTVQLTAEVDARERPARTISYRVG